MDKIIKAGICSYGMSGNIFHAPFIHVHPGFSFSAVVERSKHTAQDRYPDVKVYASVEEMLKDASLDLIIVNTPNYTHYEYTKAALNAGKNVIVEKPFTVHTSEGQELMELAASKNLLLTVYHNRRYDGDFKIVKQVIQSGDLGEVLEAEIHYDRYKPALSPKPHKEIQSPGSGILKDLGPHIIDSALCLFGFPQAVFSEIRITRPDSVVDDWFDILLYYKNLKHVFNKYYSIKN
jgi:predicted dehydrogenase